ncbi:MAG TPA: SCO family protein [Dehalococcoidia bacterium]|nr:SCO family protein [Dehalococcoidia bacterium]
MTATSLSRTRGLSRGGPIAVFAVAAALLVAACGSSGGPATPALDPSGGYRGTVLTEPLPKPSFTLLDTSGAFYDFAAQTNGYLTFVFFGYTYCPDICPDHMANIAAALNRLPDDVSQRVRVVFVTVDPERDTTERLREWLDIFDPTFVGLTGDVRSVDSAMKKALGDVYFPITREDQGGGEYSVSHAAFVLAYTPDNLAHTVYPSGLQRLDWEHDIYKLASAGWVRPSPAAVESQSTPAVAAGTAAPAALAPEVPAEHPASAPGRPRRLAPGEARKLLSANFTPIPIEAVSKSIDAAFDGHPDAARFMSQGLPLSREKLDLELRICGSRPDGNPTDSSLLACSTLGGCARLTRVLYDFYMQSGYEEFYQAALGVYNYVGTALPAEAEAFRLIVRSELRITGLPDD